MDKLFCGDEEEDVARPQVKVGKLNRSILIVLYLESWKVKWWGWEEWEWWDVNDIHVVKYRVKVRSLEMCSALLQSKHSAQIPLLHHNSIISLPISCFNEILLWAFKSSLNLSLIWIFLVTLEQFKYLIQLMHILKPGRKLVCSLVWLRQCRQLSDPPCK